MRLTELYQKYRERVEFLVVYVKEAHASDKWWLGRSRTQRTVNALLGERSRTDIVEPVTLEQRRKVAASCQAHLFNGVVPLYVDTMGDEVSAAYTGNPTRIYLIGTDGRVVYNPGTGPFGFNPDRLEEAIQDYLARDEEKHRSAS